MHLCWGNYEGPHTADIGLEKLFDLVMRAKPQALLLESCNPRHAHEWQVLRDRKRDIPEDKIIAPGVLDTTTNFVEHPELVAERLERFAGIVGRERVMAGSDCGFGTFAGFGAVHPSITFEKLAIHDRGRTPRIPKAVGINAKMPSLENPLRKIWANNGVVINGWLHIPSSFASEVMAHQGWDSLTLDATARTV